MRDLGYAAEPGRVLIGGTPAALGIDVTCTEVKSCGGAPAGPRHEAVIHRDEEPAVRGCAACTCTTPAVYRSLWGLRPRRPVPAPPHGPRPAPER